MRPAWLAVMLLAPAMGGCDEMRAEGRLKPLQASSLFEDGKSARDLVPGTVPREGPPIVPAAVRRDFEKLDALPVPLTRALLERGRERFTIHCSVCHGATGRGDGMVVRRGFTPPPSYHLPRLRDATLGHFVDVITNGWGAMYSVSDRVELGDRWAIAAYLRALQLSQHAEARSLPPQDREKALGAGR